MYGFKSIAMGKVGLVVGLVNVEEYEDSFNISSETSMSINPKCPTTPKLHHLSVLADVIGLPS